MSNGSTNTRWWENYLVRYFLPSVAGMFIVRWLGLNTRGLIWRYLPEISVSESGGFNPSKLIVWLLLGSLYCYIASYPVLVFHATRVLDFKNRRGDLKNFWLSPHAATFYFMIFVLGGVFFYNRKGAAFCLSLSVVAIAVTCFVLFQLRRLWKVYSENYQWVGGREASWSYAYLCKISSKRGRKSGDNLTNCEIVESYRHLREHGNTAFIFVLEVALCPVFWFLFRVESDFDFVRFSLISVFLFFWSFPAALVYLLGQHLERSFSLFE